MQSCSHLADFLKLEKQIISRHLDTTAVIRRARRNRNVAVAGFIRKYGGLMRTFYCTNVCEDRSRCLMAQRLCNNAAGRKQTESLQNMTRELHRVSGGLL